MEGMEQIGIIGILWFILQIIGNWKIFTKAGIPGWHSIIPFVNIYDEYKLCWKGSMGLLFIIALIAVNSLTPAAVESSGVAMAGSGLLAFIVILLQIIESGKLAKAFGKGPGFTLLLIIFDRLGRVILGFSRAEYIGKRR